MSTIIEIEVFQFDELTDSAKDKAREWFRGIAFEDQWWDSVYDDAQEVARLIGIEINQKGYKTMGGSTRYSPAIYFSGFSSQGDGACFEGSYSYRKGALSDVVKYAPEDRDLHQIALDLQQVQRRHFYQLAAHVEHSGHYNHEYCTHITVQKDGDEFYGDPSDVQDALRSFMRWIYKRLEAEYDDMNSKEYVDDNIRANEYTFTEEGERYG